MFLYESAKDGARVSVFHGADAAFGAGRSRGTVALATAATVCFGLFYLGANGSWIMTIWLTTTLLGWAFLFGAGEASDPSHRQPEQTSRTEARTIDHVSCRQTIASLGPRSELNAVVGQAGPDFVGKEIDRRFAQIGRDRTVCSSFGLGVGDLGRPFDRRDEFACFRFARDLGAADAKAADQVSLDLCLHGISPSSPSAVTSVRPMSGRQTTLGRASPLLHWGKRTQSSRCPDAVEHDGRANAK